MKKRQMRWLFFGICILLSVIFFFWVRMILGPFLFAFALAYLLNPWVEWLERHRLSRRLAIAMTFIAILIFIIITLILILPIVYNEMSKLLVVLPKTMSAIDHFLQNLRLQYRASGLPDKLAFVLDEHLGNAEVILANKLRTILSNLPETLGTLSIYILSPILAIYFLADWKRLESGFIRIVQPQWRPEWQRVWQDINHVVRRFIRGNLVVAIIVGVLIGLGVKLIGMEYAFLIALICGVTDLIPYFGPLLGAIPSVLLGLTKSPRMGLEVGLIILVVQQLEGNVISPKLMGESVGLHPLWIVFALLAGGEIAGFWGMFFAVPFAAVLRVILRHIYLRLVEPKV